MNTWSRTRKHISVVLYKVVVNKLLLKRFNVLVRTPIAAVAHSQTLLHCSLRVEKCCINANLSIVLLLCRVAMWWKTRTCWRSGSSTRPTDNASCRPYGCCPGSVLQLITHSNKSISDWHSLNLNFLICLYYNVSLMQVAKIIKF